MYLSNRVKTRKTLKNKANVGGIKIEEHSRGPKACKVSHVISVILKIFFYEIMLKIFPSRLYCVTTFYIFKWHGTFGFKNY